MDLWVLFLFILAWGDNGPIWLRYCWGSKTKKQTKKQNMTLNGNPQARLCQPKRRREAHFLHCQVTDVDLNSWILNRKALLSPPPPPPQPKSHNFRISPPLPFPQNTNCVICVPSTWFVTTKPCKKTRLRYFDAKGINSDTVLYFAYGW